MGSEVGSSRILLNLPTNTQISKTGGIAYLKSFPGVIRVLNVIFGVLSLILVLLGFPDDYPYYDEDNEENYHHQRTRVYTPDVYERKRRPWLKLTWDGRYESIDYYNYNGAGYANERANVVQLVCIVVCLAFSAFYLFLLVISPECHQDSKRRGWNRFLNLSLAILQFIGFLNGIFGLMLFRSYCCHVEFSTNERHKSQQEGYFREPCLCYITPSYNYRLSIAGSKKSYYQVTASDDNEYKTQFFNDSPDDIAFHSALPHHFIPHAISLCLMGINTVLQSVASVKI